MAFSETRGKKVLFYDNGLFLDAALRMRGSFDVIYYYKAWDSGFPKAAPYQVGEGYAGMERVYDLFEHINDVDLFAFPDCGNAGLQEYLRSRGKRVWGSAYGSELELLRYEARQAIKDAGLPVNKIQRVEGTEALRDALKFAKNVHVKISTLRGVTESWHHENWKLGEEKIYEVERELGARRSVQEFLVESHIESVRESGYDGYYAGGFPDKAIFGVESKDKGYAGRAVDYGDLPKEVIQVNEKLEKVLSKYNYRGWLSTEIRVGKDGRPYLIDCTARKASPAGETCDRMIGNWPEIMWHGAEGGTVEPEIVQPFGCQLLLSSSFADKQWLPVYCDKPNREWLALYNSTIIKGTEYVAPSSGIDMDEFGSVIGIGATMEKAKAECLKHVEQVSAFQVSYEKVALDEAIGDLA